MPLVVGRTSKYQSRRCTLHTPPHHSLKECRRYSDLVLLERAGIIRNLRQQVAFELAPAVILFGRHKPPLRYIADFCWEDENGLTVEDVKAIHTELFRCKAHLMKAIHGIDILLT